MSQELKLFPCPACGKDRADPAHSHGGQYSVICPDCYILGPRHKTVDEAIAAWNALPRALVWTSDPPKIEGFYWAKRKNTNTLHVVRVMEIREEFSVFMPGSEIDGYLHWYTQWSGPIPEPQEL